MGVGGREDIYCGCGCGGSNLSDLSDQIEYDLTDLSPSEE